MSFWAKEASEEMKRMRELSKMLEDAKKYIRKNRGQYELTPRYEKDRGKALNTVFASLKKDRSGSHLSSSAGPAAKSR